jgi:hypothetical protein
MNKLSSSQNFQVSSGNVGFLKIIFGLNLAPRFFCPNFQCLNLVPRSFFGQIFSVKTDTQQLKMNCK